MVTQVTTFSASLNLALQKATNFTGNNQIENSLPASTFTSSDTQLIYGVSKEEGIPYDPNHAVLLITVPSGAFSSKPYPSNLQMGGSPPFVYEPVSNFFFKAQNYGGIRRLGSKEIFYEYGMQSNWNLVALPPIITNLSGVTRRGLFTSGNGSGTVVYDIFFNTGDGYLYMLSYSKWT